MKHETVGELHMAWAAPPDHRRSRRVGLRDHVAFLDTAAPDLVAPVELRKPLATNPEIDRLMLDARQWRSELVIMLERQEQLLLGIKQLTSRGEVIERRLTEVLKSVGK